MRRIEGRTSWLWYQKPERANACRLRGKGGAFFLINSFFENRPQRKWTWASPDGRTKNEKDFIMTDKRHIFRDVPVINRFKTGSDHRLLRGTLNINFKLERRCLVKSTLRPTLHQIGAVNTSF
ncbi:hypothetical protein JYU34_020303 [Plutella xylostella]|uniref:Uncharacterized protein n=1 Tax=Plutella xylostella TaxID=51655 RepID=A0ABQ7PUC0_PLUXY|nr:hypothetical protein JYU34_020303 [Plutella xylostella]